MGKKSKTLPESTLLFSASSLPSKLPIIDTHTHLRSTYEAYKRKYPDGTYVSSIQEFAKGVYGQRNVQAIVDVWCEAPVISAWKGIADSAIGEGGAQVWGGLNYHFVMGVHPHNTIDYTDSVEQTITEAMSHPRCVGLGEIGLDYHFDPPHSAPEVQRSILRRQLKLAVKLGKPLTIHTREAEEDTYQILKDEVPQDWKIHVHCFTDTPEFARRLLDHFPNLYIGITGVITYTTNLNTAALVRNMVQQDQKLRILLETDAPYMVPANIYASLPATAKGKLPLCHSAMIPWTAEFVADCVNQVLDEGGQKWDADRVMKVAAENSRVVYGV